MKIRIFNKYSFLLSYLIGLLVPYLYFLFFIHIKIFFKRSIYKDKIVIFLFFFLFVQIISTLFSVFSPYNEDITRYFAIYHNYFNFLFLIFGFLWLSCDYPKIEKEFLDSTRIIFYFIIFISLFSFVYSLKTGTMIGYEGILSKLTGISNPYTQVNINSSGYLENSIFPRTRLFGIYSNSSAIIMFIISIIFLVYYINKTSFKLILSILTIAALATTGSRITLVSFIIWSFLFLHRSRKQLFISLFLIFLILLFLSNEILYLISYINELRGDSSHTRLHLYLTSLKLMADQNILFGLGLKPRLEIIKDLPIGSHSTLIGYFVKNGIIGGMLFLFVYFFIFYKFINAIFIKYYNKRSYLAFGFFSLFIIFLFEDLDAYEFVSFLTGVFAYLSYNNSKELKWLHV